jgi:hypothetical protein
MTTIDVLAEITPPGSPPLAGPGATPAGIEHGNAVPPASFIAHDLPVALTTATASWLLPPTVTTEHVAGISSNASKALSIALMSVALSVSTVTPVVGAPVGVAPEAVEGADEGVLPSCGAAPPPQPANSSAPRRAVAATARSPPVRARWRLG